MQFDSDNHLPPEIRETPTQGQVEQSPPGCGGRNLRLLVLHQIVFRVGWTFKTESVVLPAFVDHLAGGGSGVFRGFLPILSRLGQGVPPLIVVRNVKAYPRKGLLLALSACLLAIPMVIFAMLFLLNSYLPGKLGVTSFLLFYFVFCSLYGIYQVTFNTVQGKLIEPTRRGRLISHSTFWGTFPAVFAAYFALKPWLGATAHRYDAVFLTGASLFVLSGLICLILRESPDASSSQQGCATSHWPRLWETLRRNPGLLGLCAVTMLFSLSLALNPHYQAFARDRLGVGTGQQFLWVITQSASVGVFSLLIGPMADRYGNRLTCSLLTLASAATPAWSLGLIHLAPQCAQFTVWVTFMTLAFCTLSPRLASNYALELVPPEDHSAATALLQFSMTLPLLASPVLGQFIEWWGFEPLLWAAIAVVITAGLIILRLPEPRYRLPQPTGPVKPLTGDE